MEGANCRLTMLSARSAPCTFCMALHRRVASPKTVKPVPLDWPAACSPQPSKRTGMSARASRRVPSGWVGWVWCARSLQPARLWHLSPSPISRSSFPATADQEPSFRTPAAVTSHPALSQETLRHTDMFRLGLVTAGHRCAPTRRAARPIRLHSPRAATVGRSIHPMSPANVVAAGGRPPGRVAGGGASSLSGFRPAGRKGGRRWWGPRLQALSVSSVISKPSWVGRLRGVAASAPSSAPGRWELTSMMNRAFCPQAVSASHFLSTPPVEMENASTKQLLSVGPEYIVVPSAGSADKTPTAVALAAPGRTRRMLRWMCSLGRQRP